MKVTTHAIIRFQERVAAVTAEQARAALSTPFIRKAAAFGAKYVRLGTGQHVVIDGGAVVTVLPADHSPARMGLHLDRKREREQGADCG